MCHSMKEKGWALEEWWSRVRHRMDYRPVHRVACQLHLGRWLNAAADSAALHGRICLLCESGSMRVGRRGERKEEEESKRE